MSRSHLASATRLAVVLLALWAGPAWAQLALDGHASGAQTGGTSGTVTLTTSNANDVIVATSYCEGTSTPKVSGVSDTAGLSWTVRSSTPGQLGTTNENVDVWWAKSSGTLSGDVITLTLSGTIDDCSFVAFGVSGANTTTPWDANVSLPAASTAGGPSAPITGVSTTAANTMLIGVTGQRSANVTYTAGTGFTMIDQRYNGGGMVQSEVAAEYQVVAAPQSSVSVAFNPSTVNNWVIVADAIVQASGGGGCTHHNMMTLGAGC